MEIDCPPQAIAIWLEGDKWRLRFPDAQAIDIPAGAVNRLQSILIARERAAERPQARRIGLPATPTQEIMDSWKHKDDPGFHDESWEEKIRNAGARRRAKEEAVKAAKAAKERKARERRMAARQNAKELDELLAIAGL